MKFSIIIPVYNAQSTIERCVKSIENNTFKDFEIILIEDCSKDHSLDVCEQLVEAYDNIVLLHNEINKGVSFTRNKGLMHAKGEYILFVDSDDWVEENYLEYFYQTITNDKRYFAICGYVNHDEKNNNRVDIYQWSDKKNCEPMIIPEQLSMIYEKTLLQQLWNKIFINSIIKDNKIKFDESISIGEDFRFILTYLRLSGIKEGIFINKALYHYMRDQAGSLMYHVGYESVEEPLKNLRSLYQLMNIEENEIDKIIEEKRTLQIESYAYLIFHNMGMSLMEKRRLILNLDANMGKELFKRNLILFYKERIALLLRGKTI